jgi:hypothetical protein
MAKTGRKMTKHKEKKKRKSEDLRRKSEDAERNKRANGNANGKPISGNQVNRHTNGNGKLVNGNTEAGQPIGHPTGKENQPPSNATVEKDLTDDIPDSKAPARGSEKVTHGYEMAKKTTTGEPKSQNEDANKEHSKQNGNDNDDDNESELSDDPDTADQMGRDLGEGLGGAAESLARMPMDLSLAIAQGFHNAPRLYGDETVRRYVIYQVSITEQ